MKRVFRLKKGDITDGDDDFSNFLYDYLIEGGPPNSNYPVWRKNWKLTFIIQEEKNERNNKPNL